MSSSVDIDQNVTIGVFVFVFLLLSYYFMIKKMEMGNLDPISGLTLETIPKHKEYFYVN